MENTLCGAIQSIDFNNDEELYRLFIYDKHTRVEGLCSETAFKKDILQNREDEIATGYWAKQSETGYEIYRLIAGPQSDLSQLDFVILDQLVELKPRIPVFLIYFEEQEKTFYEVAYKKDTRDPRSEGTQKRISPCLKTLKEQQLTDDEKRRRKKACDFLKERGLLKEAAISRIFAYCIIGAGIILDIDAFTITPSDSIGILELKHKFPSRGKQYGINKPQLDFFIYVSRYLISVIHIILTKPDYGNETINLSAADLLTYPHKFKPSEWVYTLLDSHIWPATDKEAPAKTSLTQRSPMLFGGIDINQFSVLATYGTSPKDAWEKLKQCFPR